MWTAPTTTDRDRKEFLRTLLEEVILSWRETARVFQTSWEAVYRSVEWFIE